jgi:dipeptidyl aminopeptidase/acylaminoacyl peptidase
MSVIGVKPEGDALVVSVDAGKSERNAIVTMSFDGQLSGALFFRADADVESTITDVNRVVYGVKYSGLTPSYEFFDKELQDILPGVEALFPNAAVTLSGWTPDFDDIIVQVAGGAEGPAYYHFKPRDRTLARVAQIYEEIPDDQVGAVIPIDYRTRDGQQLTAILTLPPGAEMNGRHPTIMMPHGGPASYDAVGFDWMAQFFANRGYAVVQPNFRGSTGFGKSFEESGYGEWGRGVMQHDVTDALKAVVNSGITDPDRVCIIGASYGGYAALAGGAFTPELYKCVAAIAPVADLPQMIMDERRESGRNSWVVAYWTKLIGDVRAEREKLNEISPSKYAEAFQAPVLLIHGNDDIVVPYQQSEIMNRALKRAGKEVELVKVKGGDHWLSTSETRLETLRALDAFVGNHLGSQAGTATTPRSP